MTTKDAQIAVKALGFLDPPAPAGMIAVLYSDAASKSDADGIVAAFGGGLSDGSGSVSAKAVDASAIGDGAGYVAVIVAQGASPAAAMNAGKSHHIACLTASLALVQSGQCVLSVQSDPKVPITVSHAAAAAAGVSFNPAISGC